MFLIAVNKRSTLGGPLCPELGNGIFFGDEALCIVGRAVLGPLVE